MSHELGNLSANKDSHEQVAPGCCCKGTSCTPGTYVTNLAGASAIVTISMVMMTSNTAEADSTSCTVCACTELQLHTGHAIPVSSSVV